MDNGASSYRRFLSGDNNGLVELVAEYKDGLILYLNGYVRNIHMAEELCEDTFFRLITRKPRFSEKSSFKTWLYAIGRHVALDHLRKSAKISETPLDDVENYLEDEESLERAYIKEEAKLTLHAAIGKLPSDYRAILWLIYFDGFTPEEAAKILGKSRRQAINLHYRAKQSLRSTLEKEGFVYEEL